MKWLLSKVVLMWTLRNWIMNKRSANPYPDILTYQCMRASWSNAPQQPYEIFVCAGNTPMTQIYEYLYTLCNWALHWLHIGQHSPEVYNPTYIPPLPFMTGYTLTSGNRRPIIGDVLSQRDVLQAAIRCIIYCKRMQREWETAADARYIVCMQYVMVTINCTKYLGYGELYFGIVYINIQIFPW